MIGIHQNSLQKFMSHYRINSMNPNINMTKLEYQLVQLPTKMKYTEALRILRVKDLRPATYFELLNWGGWNGKDHIIACGSLHRVNGDKHAFQLIQLVSCEVDETGKKRCFTEECFKLLNINFPWYDGSYLLGVREIK